VSLFDIHSPCLENMSHIHDNIVFINGHSLVHDVPLNKMKDLFSNFVWILDRRRLPIE
jgi:hypothetical protein